MFRVPIDQAKRPFEDKLEAKTWVLRHLKAKQIVAAIERSDNTKMVFRCRSGPISCPFRIRANFSTKSRRWTMAVICDLHNHHVNHATAVRVDQVPKPTRAPVGQVSKRHLDMIPNSAMGVFVGVQKTAPALQQYLDTLMKRMSEDVAQIITKNVWCNPSLLSEQKDAAVARFVAETMDEYLTDTRYTGAGPCMPLLPLLNEPLPLLNEPLPLLEPDIPVTTQLPALAAPVRVIGGPLPLPPFTSIQNNIPATPVEPKTLNPTQLLKTRDLSEFKVDNLGLQMLQFAFMQLAPLPPEKIDYGLLPTAFAGFSNWPSSLSLQE